MSWRTVGLWLFSCGFALSCARARPTPQVPNTDSLPGIHIETRRLVPTLPSAKSYADDREYAAPTVEKLLLQHLARGDERRPRAALSQMLDSLVRSATSEATRGRRFQMLPGLIDGLMAWHGIAGVSPVLVEIAVPKTPEHSACLAAPGRETCTSILSLAAREFPSDTRSYDFGVDLSEDTDALRLSMLMLERVVDLQPVPRRLELNAGWQVEGRAWGEYTELNVQVVAPDQSWQSPKTTVGDRGFFAARIGCSYGRGVMQVEVMGQSRLGPRVLANFPVYCGVEPPDSVEYVIETVDPGVDAERFARLSFDLANEERSQRGLPRWLWDAEAAEIARAHSADMAKSDFLGHVSPATGNVMDRFSVAGLEALHVRENIALGFGPYGIHRRMMASPVHRLNLLADDVSRVGVGVVFGPRAGQDESLPAPVYLTQNSFEPDAGDVPANHEVELRVAANRVRRAAGQSPLLWAEALDLVAAAHARAWVRDGTGLTSGEFKSRVFALGYESLERHELWLPSWREMPELPVWTKVEGGSAGLAVLREGERGRFLLVLVVARR